MNQGISVDLSGTPASKQVARIMEQIEPYLEREPLGESVSRDAYENVYRIIKVQLLAATMVSALAAKQSADAKVPK